MKIVSSALNKPLQNPPKKPKQGSHRPPMNPLMIPKHPATILYWTLTINAIQDFFVWVGHETTYAAIGKLSFFHSSMSSSDLPKLLRTSVKPVHNCFSEKVMIFYSCTRGFMPNLHKKSWMVSIQQTPNERTHNDPSDNPSDPPTYSYDKTKTTSFQDFCFVCQNLIGL